MSLPAGARLGPYEIQAPLGAGGMGEVYRARDTKLDRDVAIKVLPELFVADPDRVARFTREAKTLAALNHPNIAAIHGLEESNGTSGLVLELVEGPTLADRIAHGPIPIDEALPIAKQIADGLEVAHEQGIVHRDLKPANIKVRPDGTVKILDFGLAKAFTADSGSHSMLANSPTITNPVGMTGVGIILGTAAYMAPEQARGRAVDKRADIWAFGAVLFEMLTAQRAFAGDDLSMTLAAVVMQEPAWAALPPATPPRVRQLLRRCLVKDSRHRIRDIGDVRLALEDTNEPAQSPDHQNRQARPVLVWALAASAIAASALAAFAFFNRPAGQTTTARLSITIPPGEEITTYPAITRDGRTIAYVTQKGSDEPLLYLRDLNSFEARPVPGSRGAKQPFFAPDGKWVAFFAQGQLQKAEVAGGLPIPLAEAGQSMGGTWSDDNTIIYASSVNSGLLQIPANGGTPTVLTKPDGAHNGYAHVFPQALPGGSRILFAIWGQTRGNAVLSLATRQWQLVLPGRHFLFGIFDAVRGVTGRLLISDPSAGVLTAPFDASHPAPTSADETVLTNVYYDAEAESRPWLAVSSTRTVVYVAGNPAKTSLAWVDREGNIEALGKDQDVYREVSLSPDGTKAVVRHLDELWIHDLQRAYRTRLTSEQANMLPVWSADGERIIFGSNRGGDWDIYAQTADGSGPANRLLTLPFDQFPSAMLSDGTLLYVEIRRETNRDLWTLAPDGKTTAIRATPFNEAEGRVSPAGFSGGRQWIAYSSDQSGRREIYLESYPTGTNRRPVSVGGGSQPQWSWDGKELFYVAGDAVMAVAMHPDGTFSAPRRLFDRSNFLLLYRVQSYHPSPDGKRFLMIRRDEGSAPRQLNVILNWSGALERSVAESR